MIPINIAEKFEQIDNFWDPKIVGELNGQYVKLARVKGEFTRHKHDLEDELFWIIEGELKMVFDDRVETIQKGECIIIPKGTYHQPVAEKEVKIMLFEPISTLNRGNIVNEQTKNHLERI